MKVAPQCFPCILRRVLETGRRITDDTWLQHKLLSRAMAHLADVERDLSPAEVMADIVEHVAKTLGSTDPFQKEREAWHQELSGVADRAAAAIGAAETPLLLALAFAARANVFDDERLSQRAIRNEVNRLGLKSSDDEISEELAFSDFDLFAKDLEQAETLLFVHDTAPELIFDRLLMDQLVAAKPGLQITCAVRAHPILLDATREDCERAGIPAHPAVKEMVDPGIHTLGSPLNDCSREYREAFEAADLVLAKGQAQAQTLGDSDRRLYFLLRIKCSVMAKFLGGKVGDTLLARS